MSKDSSKRPLFDTVSITLISVFIMPLLAVVLVTLLFGENTGVYEEYFLNTVYFIAIIAPIFIYFRKPKRIIRELALTKPKFNKLAKIIPIYFLYLAVLVLTLYLLQELGVSEEIINEEQDLAFSDVAGIHLMFVAIMTVVFPSVSEEIVFRGFFFAGLRKHSSFIVAAVISASIFGLVHYQLNVFVDTFILGIASAWLLEKTNSLWPSIALHAIKNSVAFALLFVVGV